MYENKILKLGEDIPHHLLSYLIVSDKDTIMHQVVPLFEKELDDRKYAVLEYDNIYVYTFNSYTRKEWNLLNLSNIKIYDLVDIDSRGTVVITEVITCEFD